MGPAGRSGKPELVDQPAPRRDREPRSATCGHPARTGRATTLGNVMRIEPRRKPRRTRSEIPGDSRGNAATLPPQGPPRLDPSTSSSQTRFRTKPSLSCVLCLAVLGLRMDWIPDVIPMTPPRSTSAPPGNRPNSSSTTASSWSSSEAPTTGKIDSHGFFLDLAGRIRIPSPRDPTAPCALTTPVVRLPKPGFSFVARTAQPPHHFSV